MIAYRRATQADEPAVLSLLEEIMEHHGAYPPGRERLESIVSRIIAAPDHCFLLADADGLIVGMCALLFSLSSWSAAPVCELQDVVVTVQHRREDIGRGLLRAAEEIARERGCARLFLLAESWNLGAHVFYRSLGLAEKTCLYFERELAADDAG